MFVLAPLRRSMAPANLLTKDSLPSTCERCLDRGA
jgi:hypothetical protein